MHNLDYEEVFFVSIAIFAVLSNLWAGEKDDQIIYAMLMNQLQYSLQVIQHYDNKVVLEQEFDNIISKIDKTKLRDENTVSAYSSMLDTLTNIKLQESKKLFIKQLAEKEKSEALYKSLSGSAISASVALYRLGTGNFIGGISTLAYTGVSVFFNYRDTANSVENSFGKEMFEIG